jgi:type I restriction enzyme R subunit
MKYSDEQNARITSDTVAQKELLKHVTTNFDFYKLITDNKEAKEDFNAMMFGMVKEIFNKNLSKER